MKLVVGLGNPGVEYRNTRHNVGFMLADLLAEGKSWTKSNSGLLKYVWLKHIGGIELIKPLTYMNKSGEAVKYVFGKHEEITLDDLYIVHDDLDIPLGNYKIQQGKGPKQHNGVESVENVLGEVNFWRVRIGVDNRTVEEKRIPGKKYVLSSFRVEEQSVISDVLEEVKITLKERLRGTV